MSHTLIIQSHRTPPPHPWIDQCVQSVTTWCQLNHYQHRFLGDELFEYVPAPLRDKTREQPVITSDIARLLALQQALTENYSTVVWLDADFLIFDPHQFQLPQSLYALGRETWIQQDKNGKLKAYKNVHNAFMMFRKGNTLLDFYTETAQRLLFLHKTGMVPQFIGPKFLTALHNMAALQLLESAGAFSPLLIQDIIQGQGPALELFKKNSPEVYGANLCASSCHNRQLSNEQLEAVIDKLLSSKKY